MSKHRIVRILLLVAVLGVGTFVAFGLSLHGGSAAGMLSSLLALGELSLAGAGGKGTPPAAFARGSSVSIPFELVHGHIFVHASVNRVPLAFVLDTGDKFAIIEIDRAKTLGLHLGSSVQVGGVGSGHSAGAVVAGGTFSLAGVEGFEQPLALALSLGNVAAHFGRDIDGILGTEFISRFVVEIDYAKRVMTLHDREKFTYTGAGESLPIEMDSHGHPLIEAEVTPVGGAPIRGRYLLDLGASDTLALHGPTVADHHLPGASVKTAPSVGGGAGGRSSGRLGRVAQLAIGRFNFAKPIALFSEDTAGAFATRESLGTIGEGIARRFRVFLDYGRSRVIFEPNDAFGDPFDRAASGLDLQAEGADYKTILVREVAEHSAASDAGLRAGDVLVALDGRPASELTLTEVVDRFERPGAATLTVRRGEQTLETKLTLESLE